MAEGAATIVSMATAVPSHVMTRDEVKAAVARIFPLEPRRLAGLMALYDHACVDRRYSVLPLQQVVAPRSLTEKMGVYREHAVALGSQVARACLDRAGVAPSDVDLVVSVSCTGYMVPSLDAYLVRELGLRPNIRRVPITELGCVGGAAALARASEFVRALPGTHALVVAVELSSLTFQPDDVSDANLVSCAFFGDGAAAALLAGGPGPGIRVLDTESCLIPESLDAMGFDLRDGGFHMVLSKEVPELLRRDIRALVDGVLTRNGLQRSDVSAFALHPGGKKILDYLEGELELERTAVQPSWDVLREFGNLSSATILFVLDRWHSARRPGEGEYGLAIGFGPGVSAELMLLQWA
jgi:alkylresorcinol/alkylpyrone synthase